MSNDIPYYIDVHSLNSDITELSEDEEDDDESDTSVLTSPASSSSLLPRNRWRKSVHIYESSELLRTLSEPLFNISDINDDSESESDVPRILSEPLFVQGDTSALLPRPASTQFLTFSDLNIATLKSLPLQPLERITESLTDRDSLDIEWTGNQSNGECTERID